MSTGIFEVIFHARAGQGAKTVAELLVEAALDKGKHVQAWPNYGAERSGAPMRTFVRISNTPIKTHAAIREADAVVVIDPTLLKYLDVTSNLKKDGILVVNYCNTDDVRAITKFTGKIFAVDSSEISHRIMGRNMPNMAMLGALVKVTGLVEISAVVNSLRKMFTKKIGEEMTAKNVMALKEGYEKI